MIHHMAVVDGQGRLPRHLSESIRDQLQLMSGQTVEIIIRRTKRSTSANRWYWGVLLKSIHEAMLDAGVVCTIEWLHNLFKSRYLPCEADDDGTLPPSTRTLSSQEFFEYIQRIVTDEEVLRFIDFAPLYDAITGDDCDIYEVK